jgi:hypothetical protein
MDTQTISQRTHNERRRAAVMCAPLREAAWRLRLSGSFAALAAALPADALVGAGSVRLDRVPEGPVDDVVLITGSIEVLGPFVPSVR